jgi:hypothetical protein
MLITQDSNWKSKIQNTFSLITYKEAVAQLIASDPFLLSVLNNPQVVLKIHQTSEDLFTPAQLIITGYIQSHLDFGKAPIDARREWFYNSVMYVKNTQGALDFICEYANENRFVCVSPIVQFTYKVTI